MIFQINNVKFYTKIVKILNFYTYLYVLDTFHPCRTHR